MKHTVSIILILALLASLCLSSCAGGDQGHTLYVRDTYSRESLTAQFLSSSGSDTLSVTMKKIGEDDGGVIFSCAADTARYDRVVISDGDKDTIRLAFNDYVSGWELNSLGVTPYTYGKENTKPEYTRVQFPYENRTKDILIWAPADYDASGEPYSVIYMTDGQNLFNPGATSTGSWAAAESAQMMASLSENRVIIVGIENADGYRDEELTPDIGETAQEGYQNGHGAYFCDFVADTVVPYIEENYHVYTDPAHNAVCGSSSGGIECFYIGMEHPEKFGTVGALSPAFGLFDTAVWDEYLSGRDFSNGYPFVYIYNGAADDLEQWLLCGAQDMPRSLKRIGYPEDKVTLKVYEQGGHNERYWRAVFPDFLKYMFPST